MDPNVKPQISVDIFDHDNPQFYPGVYVALIKLLIYPVSTCTTGRCSSIMKKPKPPLRSTAKGDKRLSSLVILPYASTKALIDKVGVVRVKGTCLAHCL